MESTIQGRVYKFGDNVNSDIIIPGRYLIYIDRERLKQLLSELENLSRALRDPSLAEQSLKSQKTA